MPSWCCIVSLYVPQSLTRITTTAALSPLLCSGPIFCPSLHLVLGSSPTKLTHLYPIYMWQDGAFWKWGKCPGFLCGPICLSLIPLLFRALLIRCDSSGRDPTLCQIPSSPQSPKNLFWAICNLILFAHGYKNPSPRHHRSCPISV